MYRLRATELDTCKIQEKGMFPDGKCMTLLVIPDPRVAGGWEGWQIEALGQGVLSYEGSQAEKPTVCEPQSSTRVKSRKWACFRMEKV